MISAVGQLPRARRRRASAPRRPAKWRSWGSSRNPLGCNSHGSTRGLSRGTLYHSLRMRLLLFLAAAPLIAQQYDIVLANGRVIDPASGLDAVRHIGIR